MLAAQQAARHGVGTTPYVILAVGLALFAHVLVTVSGQKEALQAAHHASWPAFSPGSALSAFPMFVFFPGSDNTDSATSTGAKAAAPLISVPFVLCIEVLIAFLLTLVGGLQAWFPLVPICRSEELSRQRYEATAASGNDFMVFNTRARAFLPKHKPDA